MARRKRECKRGHLMGGKNLLIYQRGRYEVHVCRTCKSERTRVWHLAKKGEKSTT